MQNRYRTREYQRPTDINIGVDGCKTRWFFVSIGTGDALEFGVSATIKKLWRNYSKAKWILLDIPIELPSKEIKTRPCDKVARQALSLIRHHSILGRGN